MSENQTNTQNFLLGLVLSAAVAGIVALTATYFFLGRAGTTIIDNRVDERIHELDTADRIFVLNQTGPMLQVRPLGRSFKHQVISDVNGYAIAIHVTFRHGEGAYSAEIESDWHEKATVTFSRGESPSLVKLGKKRERERLRLREREEEEDY